MKSLKTLAVTLLVLLALAGIVVVAALYKLGKPQSQVVSIEQIQASEGMPVKAVRPVVMDFADYFYCDGDVVADVRAMLRAKVGEIVEAVNARVGEPVHKGQVLVGFRKDDLEAEIRAAETAFEEAERNYERNKNLLEQRVISADRVDESRTRKENAAAGLEAARSRLESAQLTSPIDGVVEQRWVEPGEYKGMGDELISVVDLSTVEVSALVPEEDMAGLGVGGEGEFRLETAVEWLKGRISRISPSTADPNRFFDVFLKVDNKRSDAGWLMRPGMYAEVRFLRGTVSGALAVPDSTVVREDSTRVIYVVETRTEQVAAGSDAGLSAQPDEGGFAARLKRGLARVGGAGEGEGDPSRAGRVAERPVTRARRVVVSLGFAEKGFVQVMGADVSQDSLVVERPRDEIRDGTLVKLVSSGEAQ